MAKGRLGKSTQGVNKLARAASPSEEDEGEPTVRVFINDIEVGDHPSGAISFHQPLISPLRVVQHLVTPGGTLVAPQEVLMKTNLTQNGGPTYFLLRLLLSLSVPFPSTSFPFSPCESIWWDASTFSCTSAFSEKRSEKWSVILIARRMLHMFCFKREIINYSQNNLWG